MYNVIDKKGTLISVNVVDIYLYQYTVCQSSSLTKKLLKIFGKYAYSFSFQVKGEDRYYSFVTLGHKQGEEVRKF